MDNTTSRVLIVDDMAMNRLVLSSLLATHGIIADQAESGMECIKLCQQQDYDLILLDHRMPYMDGVDTLIRLKEMFKERDIEVPIICHTTSEGKQNINLYKAAGFADVLIKPIDPNELFDVIMTYLPEEADAKTSSESAPDTALPDAPSDEKSAEDEIDKLPLWLKLVPHIDLVAGIANNGSAEDYLDALYIFYSSIEEKADEICYFLENCDWTMYALRVHSLKSMARLVGAKKLGDQAARLEIASHEGDVQTVRKNTRSLIESYLAFSTQLKRLSDPEFSDQFLQRAEPPQEEAAPPEPEFDYARSVLFIQSGQGIIQKSVQNNLESAGFFVTSIPDEPDRIIAHRKDSGIIIYHTGHSDNAHIGITMSLLSEICQDDNKILCLTGEMSDLKTAMQTNGSYRVSKCYQRPINLNEFLKDMEFFSYLQKDYLRKKTIYIVDDDKSYLSVIERWLLGEYNVSGFCNVKDALGGLSAVIPDLILLDYEMPEMNGFELMKTIRASYPDTRIPIIFLTGKNDKDLVFKVLEYKPDGYLLKTSQKDTILDVIHRFFAESMFKLSQKGITQETSQEP